MSERNNGVSVLGLLGMVLAGLMSWFKWHSIFWVLVHAFLGGWIYVIYYLIRYGTPTF